ncbi:PhoD-like phosphatase [Chloropicon roscoffensis]|uniref:PhoD-like phosphatase n=1 Tax=Chloropicon roscoffensis TaxID=1461544 RepID=A0AAX4P3B5_9CHLO
MRMRTRTSPDRGTVGRASIPAALLILAVALWSWAPAHGERVPRGGTARRYDPAREPLRRLSFGSCNDQRKDQSIWGPIVEGKPDVWLWLGDNIYADRKVKSYPKEFRGATVAQMRAMYDQLSAVPGYRALLGGVGKVVATWDDHDYGLDDSGKELPYKRESQGLLLDFLGVPEDSELRRREGVYNSHTFGPEGKRVKLIVLDTRYHRDPIFSDGDMLGEEQWRWLGEELTSGDAQVTLIASSIQVLPNHHVTLCPICYIEDSPFRVETWAHFPREKRRLADLIRDRRAEGVILLSGDVHLGEVLRSPAGCLAPYPINEITSSGMTHSASASFPGIALEVLKRFSPNPFSLGMHLDVNYGTVDFDWDGPSPVVTLSVRDREGRAALQRRVSIADLKFPEEGAQVDPQGDCTEEAQLPWWHRCRFCIILFSGFVLAALVASWALAWVLAGLKRVAFASRGTERARKKRN